MMMEAMRLSLIDHEEHQRKQDDEIRQGSETPNGSAIILQSTPQNRRVSDPSHPGKEKHSTASKLFSKIGARSRSGSAASSLKAISFSTSNLNLAGPSRSPNPGAASPGRRSSTPPAMVPSVSSLSATPTTSPGNNSAASPTAMPSSPLSNTYTTTAAALSRSPPKSLSPPAAAPIAPITTLANANKTPGATAQVVSSSSESPMPSRSKPQPPVPEPINLPTSISTTHAAIFGEPPAIPTPLGSSALSVSPKNTTRPPRVSFHTPDPIVPSEPVAPRRVSLDMPTLTPDHATTSTHAEPTKFGAESIVQREVSSRPRPAVDRSETGLSTVESVREYASLDSDEED